MNINWEEFCIQITRGIGQSEGFFKDLGQAAGEEKTYGNAYKVLEQNFKHKAKTFQDILQRVTLLNRYYYTGIQSTSREVEIAEYIHDNITDDNITNNKDPKNFLATHINTCKEKNLRHYSFLTKYFALTSFHQTNGKKCLYPIYDSNVYRVINHVNEYGISEEQLLKKSLPKFHRSDYVVFYTNMQKIKSTLETKYNLQKDFINFRYLDIFMWRAGKKTSENK